jgi:enolase
MSSHQARWSRRTCYALSVAFHYATSDETAIRALNAKPPRLLLNFLNGGMHAYTNPVASDFPEFLLVPHHEDVRASIDEYRAMLAAARQALRSFPRRLVGGNEVHDLGAGENARAIELVLELLQKTGLAHRFGLMIDGSGGSLWDGQTYHLPVSRRRMSRDEFCHYWLELIRRYDLVMVEDPFAETDLYSWQRLAAAKPKSCLLLGDNLTATRCEHLQRNLDWIDGAVVKPDQNGTVSGAAAFAQSARAAGVLVVASHRSIESDSLFLSHFSCGLPIDMVKIGPFSDFSAIAKTNEILRRWAA